MEIVIDTGEGTRGYEIVATRAGRRVEVRIARGVVEVIEVTRSGTPVRTARFLANRVVALVEHPRDAATADEQADEQAHEQRGRTAGGTAGAAS